MGLRAWIERALSPSLSTCKRCHRPWKIQAVKRTGIHTWTQIDRDRYWGLIGVESHITNYDESSGCFPLCKACWSELTPEERLPYYRKLWVRWMSQAPATDVAYIERVYNSWSLIEAAVLAGK